MGGGRPRGSGCRGSSSRGYLRRVGAPAPRPAPPGARGGPPGGRRAPRRWGGAGRGGTPAVVAHHSRGGCRMAPGPTGCCCRSPRPALAALGCDPTRRARPGRLAGAARSRRRRLRCRRVVGVPPALDSRALGARPVRLAGPAQGRRARSRADEPPDRAGADLGSERVRRPGSAGAGSGERATAPPGARLGPAAPTPLVVVLVAPETATAGQERRRTTTGVIGRTGTA